MHFDRSPFTRSCQGEKGLNNFKFGTFIGRFPSDDVTSMVVKGLIHLARVAHNWTGKCARERKSAYTRLKFPGGWKRIKDGCTAGSSV